jgi:predicted pyridoxine 5'-phosphate oxidase superfamily flavin-nucleotide-binding protein
MGDTTFHPGEQAVRAQKLSDRAAIRQGATLQDGIYGQAQAYVGHMFMVLVGSVDSDGYPWASLLVGPPGFADAGHPQYLNLTLPQAQRDPADPLWQNLSHNPRLGLLFIDLNSRQRLRVNGRLNSLTRGDLELFVCEAYGNCPKYIQQRRVVHASLAEPDEFPQRGKALNDELRAFIHGCDTLFVASDWPESGCDVSHRGGAPGFVRVEQGNRLRIPDYPGNNLFNTLGNFMLNPKGGICIPDFSHSRLLQLTGDVTLNLDQNFWEFEVREWLWRTLPARLSWSEPQASPFNRTVE